MSEHKDKPIPADLPNVEKTSQPAGLSVETLLSMLLQQQKETAKAYEKLGDALLESRKPYVDPAVLEAKKQALEERRKDVAKQLRVRIATKRTCLHRRTNEDGTYADRYNIKWQMHPNGVITGVCGTCFSPFNASTDAKDRELLLADGSAMRNMARARGVGQDQRGAYAV